MSIVNWVQLGLAVGFAIVNGWQTYYLYRKFKKLTARS